MVYIVWFLKKMCVLITQVGTLNYMPPEAIKDTSSQPGQARSKVLI